jgi:hypothetical protein
MRKSTQIAIYDIDLYLLDWVRNISKALELMLKGSCQYIEFGYAEDQVQEDVSMHESIHCF